MQNIKKLPVWAQQEIGRLERNVANLQKELDTCHSDQPSLISIREFERPNRPIGDHHTIQFQAQSGTIEVRIRKWSNTESDVEIYTSHGTLALIPSSSNVAYARVIKR